MNLSQRVPMLLLAFIAGWLLSGAVGWLSGALGGLLPAAFLGAMWMLAWLFLALGVKYFAVGFVYVLGLGEDWRLAGAWTFVGTFLLSALDRRSLWFSPLPLAIGAAAAFAGSWLAQSRRDHPMVERMRELLYSIIPQA